MNDDFLYSRQEAPEPAFVAELQEKLQSMDSPEKAKRKNGQRRFGWKWKAVAAVVALIVLGGTVFWNTPEIHIPVTNFILGNPNEVVLRNAQERMGFEIPDIPYGYYIGIIQSTDLFIPQVYVGWQSYRGDCVIWFSVQYDPQYGETFQQNQEYNRQLEEWADYVELGNGVEAVWRTTTFNGMPNPRVLQWYFEGYYYQLEAMEECVSAEVLTVIAQSTLDDMP